MPQTPPFISHKPNTHTHTLYICKQTSPVWHHSTTAGYGSKEKQQISVDYINTKA